MSSKMKVCKACNQQIATSAKTCPHCGAKNKKPIIKKWWFWLIIVVVIGSVASASGSGNIDVDSDVDDKSVSVSDYESDNNTDNETTASKTTIGELNALRKAKDYLRISGFSYEGLINQLEFEQFSHEEAVYAVENCGADWNEQAAKKAKEYMNVSAFSRSGLIDQLEFEGFTHEQAVYGVEANGY